MAEHQKYRIIERLDAGGMAEVFRGIAESLQGFKKNVAIKRILPHLTKHKKFIAMFLDEARLSLHLQHANIVSIFDIGVAPPEGDSPGAYFIVMEYVDGTNLKGLIESLRRQSRRMKLSHVIYILMEVCKGLAYAHDATDPETGRSLNIVHRDISPPNILLSKNGEVKLVDFGLAKATSQLEQTDPGVVKGKFSYLSPEGALGREVDRRADIFAVGILLYELITGRRLFYGENDYQTVELVRQARIPPLAEHFPEVDGELEAILRKSLAREVNQRYQQAGELQDALAQYLFSRNLKVTSRDIATLVRETVRERKQSLPPTSPAKSLIDALIQDEMVKFTSLDEAPPGGDGSGSSPSYRPGERPLSADSLSGAGAAPLDAGSFIDPRAWAEETSSGDLPDADTSLSGLSRAGRRTSGRMAAAAATAGGGGIGGGPGVETPTPDPSPEGPIEPIEALLEPDAHTGIEPRPDERKPVNAGLWVAVLALVILGGGGAFLFLMKSGIIHR